MLQFEEQKKMGTEKFHAPKAGLRFSVTKVSLTLAPGEKQEGSFIIYSSADAVVDGFVSSSRLAMKCISSSFSGSRDEISYRFDAAPFAAGDSVEGYFRIISNQGEYKLPFEVKIMQNRMESSLGAVRNIYHFANLARTHWKEAVDVFYHPDFPSVFTAAEQKERALYRGLSAHQGNMQNVEAFLIAAGKKTAVEFLPEVSALEVELPLVEQKTIVRTLRIRRNGWGYTRLEVGCEGAFLRPGKAVLNAVDFQTGTVDLPLLIDPGALHAGVNLGAIVLKAPFAQTRIPVTVRYCMSPALRTIHRRQAHVLVAEMMQLYEDFRGGKITGSSFAEAVGPKVRQLYDVDRNYPYAALYRIHYLAGAGLLDDALMELQNLSRRLSGDTSKLPLYPVRQLGLESSVEFAYRMYLTVLCLSMEQERIQNDMPGNQMNPGGGAFARASQPAGTDNVQQAGNTTDTGAAWQAGTPTDTGTVWQTGNATDTDTAWQTGNLSRTDTAWQAGNPTGTGAGAAWQTQPKTMSDPAWREYDQIIHAALSSIRTLRQRYPSNWWIAWLSLYAGAEFDTQPVRPVLTMADTLGTAHAMEDGLQMTANRPFGEDFSRLPESTLRLLRDQFAHGAHSPLLYLEAYEIYEQNPELLQEFSDFEEQVLLFASRHKYLSPAVLTQVNYAASRQRNYSDKLLRVLMDAYEQIVQTSSSKMLSPLGKDTLSVICTLLIRGNETDSRYFPWYQAGVEEQLPITRLYDYYMMAMPENYQGRIPQMVIMYFAFQSSLPYERNIILYRYLVEHRRDVGDIYEAYRQRLDDFTQKALQDHRMGDDAAILYQRFLTDGRVLTSEQANAAVPAVFCVELTTKNAAAARVVVVYRQYQEEQYFPLKNNKALFPLYGEDAALFLEDQAGNRYVVTAGVGSNLQSVTAGGGSSPRDAAAVETSAAADRVSNDPGTPPKEAFRPELSVVLLGSQSQLRRLMDVGQLAPILNAYPVTNAGFDLYLSSQPKAAAVTENSEPRLAHLLQGASLVPAFRQQVLLELLRYYEETDQDGKLDALLQQVQDSIVQRNNSRPFVLDAAGRAALVHAMVKRGKFLEAAAWVRRYGAFGIDAETLMGLCSGVLEESEPGEDAVFAAIAHECFLKGTYNERLLLYLSHFLDGLSSELETVRQAMLRFEMDDFDLCCRMLTQLLFTGTLLSSRDDIIAHCIRGGAPTALLSCAVAQSAHYYFVQGRPMSREQFDLILRYGRDGVPVVDICRIAWLQERAARAGQIVGTELEVTRLFLEDLLAEGIIFPFFRQFLGLVPALAAYADETLVEYRAAQNPAADDRELQAGVVSVGLQEANGEQGISAGAAGSRNTRELSVDAAGSRDTRELTAGAAGTRDTRKLSADAPGTRDTRKLPANASGGRNIREVSRKGQNRLANSPESKRPAASGKTAERGAANTAARRNVVYHYAMEKNGRRERYASRKMKEMYEDVYVTGFLLFFGEQMHYYITDDVEEKHIVESGTVGQDARIPENGKDRFGALNEISMLAALGRDEEVLERIQDYERRSYLVEALFGAADDPTSGKK